MKSSPTMVLRQWSVRLAASLLAGLAALAGCGDGRSSAERAEDAADTVCETLRAFVNEMSDAANEMSNGVTDSVEPVVRQDALLSGFDHLVELARDYESAMAELELPNVAERGRLLDDLRTGATDGVAELLDQRPALEEFGTIEDAEERGAIGIAFTTVEKVLSVSEPAIASYDDTELRTAFADNPACEHVIQPFRD